MNELWQQQVHERARAIWRREGSPNGSPDQFIAMAEQELIAEGQRPLSNPIQEKVEQFPKAVAEEDDVANAAVDGGPVDPRERAHDA